MSKRRRKILRKQSNTRVKELKKRRAKSKVSRGKEIVNIRAAINYT
jgi:hypothetical protein